MRGLGGGGGRWIPTAPPSTGGGADRGGGGRYRGSKAEVKGTLPVQAALPHS